jgi:hypothetical protein
MSRLLVSLALGVALSPVLANETTVALLGCEYQLELPSTPAMKDGRPAFGTSLGPSRVALLGNRIPAYRIECQGFSRLPPKAETAMVDDMLEQTQRMKLLDFQHSVDGTRLGTVVEYSGIEVRSGQRFVVSGRNILGFSSVLSIVITEPAATYPSAETRRVLRSLRR